MRFTEVDVKRPRQDFTPSALRLCLARQEKWAFPQGNSFPVTGANSVGYWRETRPRQANVDNDLIELDTRL
jgi:hypothetical protein